MLTLRQPRRDAAASELSQFGRRVSAVSNGVLSFRRAEARAETDCDGVGPRSMFDGRPDLKGVTIMPALTANKNVASGDGFDFTSNAQVYTIDRDVTLSVDDGDGVASSFKSDEIANYGVINAPAISLEAAVS